MTDQSTGEPTTSSRSVTRLARATGRPERFVGLHVFDPVPRMDLIELVFPRQAAEDTMVAEGACGQEGRARVYAYAP